MTKLIDIFFKGFEIHTDIYAAISATMIVWLLVIIYCHTAFLYTHFKNYIYWHTTTPAERTDVILNLSAASYFLYNLFQRLNAMYAFATKEITITQSVSTFAPTYLPLGIFALSGWLWWIAFNRHPEHYRVWWCGWTWIGFAAYFVVTLVL